jgi:hypothetical protein
MKTLSARERRHKAVLNKIARLTLARNKGIKAIVAAETQLPGLERQARRYDLPVKPRKPKPAEHPRIAANHERIANELVEFAAKLPTPEALAVATGEPKPKPKRQRKPKVGWVFPEVTKTTDIPNSEIFGDPGPIDHDARMVAMGFRKTKKRKADVD